MDDFSEFAEIDVNPEKKIAWGGGKQELFSCCEKATRDPSLRGGGFCGGAGYRCFRRLYTIWWTFLVLISSLCAVIFFLWISLGTFVAPTVVSAWYLVITKELAEFKKQYRSFLTLNNLRVQADLLTAKLRFATDGVGAIFDDEGKYLGLLGLLRAIARLV